MSNKDDLLLARFVAAFDAHDHLTTDADDPIAWDFATDETDEHGDHRWRPRCVVTERADLDRLYARLPGHFPPLYERLALSYRWAEVDLGSFRLLANPLGPGLDGLLAQIQLDEGLWETLAPNRYLQFGKGPDLNYDPVCFDISRRRSNGECPVVQLDHEAILCHFRIVEVAELAPTFRDLVIQTIAHAGRAS